MSTSNYQQRPQGAYTVTHFEGGRLLPQQQLERVSVATYPLSCNGSPVSLIYQPELKRSFLFQSNFSNPERHAQLSKSGESLGGHEQLHYPQPNVQYCLVDKHKNSTPTHSTSFTDGVRGQPIPSTFNHRTRKGSEYFQTNPAIESQTILQTDRRINVQQPHTVLIRTTIGNPQYPRTEVLKNSVVVHSQVPTPVPGSPSGAIQEQNSPNESGNVHYRVPGYQYVMIRGSPGSNYSDNKLTVKFEYQQPKQEPRQDRLDHIKNKTYAELVGRQNQTLNYPTTYRVTGSRYSMGQDEGRSMTLTSSMKELSSKLTQSMHTRTGCYEYCQLEMKSVQSQTEKPVERVGADRKPYLAASIRSQTESEYLEANTVEQDNAFKKDKRSSLEPNKSIYDSAKLSPQNAPLRKEAELRKSTKLSHTPEVLKNTCVDYLKPSRNVPVNDFGVSKYSPTSFTKVKADGPSTATLNKSFVELSTASPLSSTSGSPTKSPVRRRPCFSDFNIGRKLGKGKYGDVFLAMHKSTGFICAMKIIEKSLIHQYNVEHQLISEIKLQSYLKHENIVQLYGYFDDEEKFYLLLEFCEDGELADLLKQHKRLAETEASNIVEQICRGVDFMHRHRVIHRDLKPENIIMQDGIVKVCDFGWAVHVANGLRQTFCGTPLYVSPEVLKGDFYDDKIDIWAIGILTYELLVGRVPFRINCYSDLNKIIHDEIVFPDYVPISNCAKDFIYKALQKNPNSRIEMDELLNHPFLASSKRQEYMRHLNE